MDKVFAKQIQKVQEVCDGYDVSRGFRFGSRAVTGRANFYRFDILDLGSERARSFRQGGEFTTLLKLAPPDKRSLKR